MKTDWKFRKEEQIDKKPSQRQRTRQQQKIRRTKHKYTWHWHVSVHLLKPTLEPLCPAESYTCSGTSGPNYSKVCIYGHQPELTPPRGPLNPALPSIRNFRIEKSGRDCARSHGNSYTYLYIKLVDQIDRSTFIQRSSSTTPLPHSHQTPLNRFPRSDLS